MKTIWFKQRYVGDILSGDKVDTIRKSPFRMKLEADELVAFSVGPRRPFAVAKIIELATIDREVVAATDADRAAFLIAEYGDQELCVIRFCLSEILPPGLDYLAANRQTQMW